MNTQWGMMSMELERETGWQLHPLGGNTGQAYMGIRNEEKLFLKRNSSPFLAALSVEGITPRLVWTKRIGNGDVLTAQEWCNGRTLNKDDMKSARVAQLFAKIHTSETLKRMLQRVGGIVYYPEDMLSQYVSELPFELLEQELLYRVIETLKKTVPYTPNENLTVCHGDVYRKNWLLSDTNHLYVVDWDSAMIADPIYDLAMLLSKYVPEEEWGEWLSSYGVEHTMELDKRLKWYAVLIDLQFISELHKDSRYQRMNEILHQLEERMKNWFNHTDL